MKSHTPYIQKRLLKRDPTRSASRASHIFSLNVLCFILALLLFLLAPSSYALTWSLNSGNENWPSDKRAAIVSAMNEAVSVYNANGFFDKRVTANYNASVPTAQASYSGWIDFGGSISSRVALHEISHTLGVGQVPAWNTNRTDNKWTGAYGVARVKLYDGASAVLNADTMHFWPYGLNYDDENTPTKWNRHCRMVSAMRRDMGIVGDSDSDGLPDDWETFNFGNLSQTAAGDADVDAATNLAEYQADTNPAQAFAFTWKGGAGTWDTATANWTGAATRWRNGISDSALFTGSSGTVTTVSGLQANTMTFNTNGYRVTGNTFTLCGIKPTITAATGVTATLETVLAGSSGLTKAGNGTLILSAINTLSGDLSLSGGTLDIAPGGRLFMSSSGSMSIASGATLAFTGNWGWDGTLRYLGVDTGENIINGGALRHSSTSNPKTSAGAGRLFTIGASGATLESATAGAEFSIGYRTDYGTSLASQGGLLTLTGAGDGDLNYTVPGDGGLIKNGEGTWKLTRSGSSYAGATIVNAGRLVLGTSNTLSGAINVYGGVLEVGHPHALGSAGRAISFSANSDGVVDVACNSSVNAYDLSTSSTATGTLRLGRATPGAGIKHVLGYLSHGNNILTVEAGANVTSGTPEVQFDGMNLGAGTGYTAPSTLKATTASISITGLVSIAANSSPKTLKLDGDSTGNSISGIISNGLNTLTLLKAGSGTWTLSGANTFTGSVTVALGTLRIEHSAALGSGPKTVTLNASAEKRLELDGSKRSIVLPSTLNFLSSGINGTLRNVAGTNTVNSSISMTSGNGNTKILSDGGLLLLNSAVTANTGSRILDLGGTSTATNTFAGVLGNASTPGLNKSDAGTWVLAGANTYPGLTHVMAGELILAHATGLGTTSGETVVSNTARLSLSGSISVAGERITLNGDGGDFYGALRSIAGSNSWSGGVTLATPGTRLGAKAGTLEISGPIGDGANACGLIVRNNTGATTLLSGSSTYDGTTQLIGGLTRLAGGDDRLPATTALLLGGSNVSGILDLNGCNQTITGLQIGQTSGTFANAVTNSAVSTAQLTFFLSETNLTCDAPLAGNMALLLAGNGTLTLARTNTCSGMTTITGGTLVLKGNLAGAMTVSNGIFTAQGRPAISSDLLMQANGTLRVRLNGTTPGTGYDQVRMTSTTASTSLAGMLDIVASGGLPTNTAFTVIDRAGTSPVSGSFVGMASNTVFSANGYNWTISYTGGDGNDVVLTLADAMTTWRYGYFNTTLNSGDAADSTDPDQDGMSNMDEFIAGTIPTNSLSRLAFTGTSSAANKLTLDFPSVLGRTYRIQWTDTLVTPVSWNTLSNAIPGTAQLLQINDTMTSTQRFYRIQIVQ
jgi:autotransporter-associated beta strand protein